MLNRIKKWLDTRKEAKLTAEARANERLAEISAQLKAATALGWKHVREGLPKNNPYAKGTIQEMLYDLAYETARSQSKK